MATNSKIDISACKKFWARKTKEYLANPKTKLCPFVVLHDIKMLISLLDGKEYKEMPNG